MSGFKDLPRKDFIVLMLSLTLLCSIYAAAFYQAYINQVPHTATFKVFYTETQDRGNTQTQVLTYGVGKFYFIGNWTGQFELDHTYNVTYVQTKGEGKHSYNDLIITAWNEIV